MSATPLGHARRVEPRCQCPYPGQGAAVRRGFVRVPAAGAGRLHAGAPTATYAGESLGVGYVLAILAAVPAAVALLLSLCAFLLRRRFAVSCRGPRLVRCRGGGRTGRGRRVLLPGQLLTWAGTWSAGGGFSPYRPCARSPRDTSTRRTPDVRSRRACLPRRLPRRSRLRRDPAAAPGAVGAGAVRRRGHCLPRGRDHRGRHVRPPRRPRDHQLVRQRGLRPRRGLLHPAVTGGQPLAACYVGLPASSDTTARARIAVRSAVVA